MKIKNGEIKYRDDEVYCKLSATYIQNSDTEDPIEPDGVQELTIYTEDSGGGTYYVIETQRWAVDNLEDLTEVLEDYKKRCGQ